MNKYSPLEWSLTTRVGSITLQIPRFRDTAILVYPEEYRVRLRTSNGIERVNGEIRRRERVIRIFPNREAVVRMIGSVLMEIEA